LIDFSLISESFLLIFILFSLFTWLSFQIRDPLEFVTPPVVVNTVVVPAVVSTVVVPVPVVVVLLIFVPDDENDEDVVKDEEVVKDEDVPSFSISEEDSKEGHANTTPSEPEDQPKSATEHVEELELIVGDEPKINATPSPSVDLLEELEDE